MLAPEYGGDGKRTDRCDKYPEPIVTFPGHYAPNDLIFYTGRQFPQRFRNGAFVTFHGSQQRTPLPEQGYKVAFVPFAGRLPSADWEVFADGFAGGKPLASPRDATYRPMGLAQGQTALSIFQTRRKDGSGGSSIAARGRCPERAPRLAHPGMFGLRGRDVMGYTLIVFLALTPVVLVLVTLMRLTLPYPL